MTHVLTQPAPRSSWPVAGPLMWAELHHWAIGGGHRDGDAWLERFTARIPCGDCRRHWIDTIDQHPPEFDSVASLFAWTVTVHNRVNERLGKPTMSLDDAIIFWSSHERPEDEQTVAVKIRADRMPPQDDAKSEAQPALSFPSGSNKTSTAERLLLETHLSPGDVVMLTATVRDLHRAYPGRFETAVDTSASDLWSHNPWVTPVRSDASYRRIDMHYPLINRSNQTPLHFLHGYTQYLSDTLGLPIPVTEFKGDVHLSDEEKGWTSQVEQEFGHRGRYWVMMAGGKYDFTAKWWPPAYYQKVVDHFAGRLQFVQCGEKSHWHPRLRGAFDLVGRTSLRQFVRLMYHAEGVVCPVTFAMHLAAAVPPKHGRLKPCVVIAGGREPPQWEAYPGHQFLHTIGALPCCAHGGCWRSRCQTVGDGDAKDHNNLCERPVPIDDQLRVPQCMVMIRPEDVIRSIENSLLFA